MTISEVFEKYKHLDQLLSDRKWLPDTFIGSILFDLWQAVKVNQEAVSESSVEGSGCHSKALSTGLPTA